MRNSEILNQARAVAFLASSGISAEYLTEIDRLNKELVLPADRDTFESIAARCWKENPSMLDQFDRIVVDTGFFGEVCLEGKLVGLTDQLVGKIASFGRTGEIAPDTNLSHQIYPGANYSKVSLRVAWNGVRDFLGEGRDLIRSAIFETAPQMSWVEGADSFRLLTLSAHRRDLGFREAIYLLRNGQFRKFDNAGLIGRGEGAYLDHLDWDLLVRVIEGMNNGLERYKDSSGGIRTRVTV